METIETEIYKGYKIEIFADEDTESPREWSNLSEIYHWHRDYCLGKEIDPESFDSVKEMLNSVRESDSDIFLPLRAYEHGNISLSTGREYPFNDQWDSFDIGFIHFPASVIRAEYSVKRITKGVRAKALSAIEQELRTYNVYLNGGGHGWVTYAPDGREIDSCCGILDDSSDYALTCARESVEHDIKEQQEAERFVALSFAL